MIIKSQREGAWSWGDWGDNVDMEILYNTWYYLSCKSFKSMEELFNQPEDAQWENDKINSIATNFNTVFWNGKEYRSPAYRDATDDRSNAMAILAGLALPKDYSSIKNVLMKNEHASPYMEKYVIEALL